MSFARNISEKTQMLISCENISFSAEQIERDVAALFNNKTIKIMQSLDDEQDEFFLGRTKNDFVVIWCHNLFAKTVNISNDLFFELAATYYACRSFAYAKLDYSDKIIDFSKKLERILFSCFQSVDF